MDYKAGPELDAEVARRVFGKPIAGYYATHWTEGEPVRCEDVGCPTPHLAVVAWLDDWKTVPAYSTDISNAWEIVEHLIALDWIYAFNLGYIPSGWECELESRWPEDRPHRFTSAATPALAICLAALATVTTEQRP